MIGILKTACIQATAGPDIESNLEQVGAFIREAAAKDAKFIATPENTCRMRATREGKFEASFEENDHPAIPFYSDTAKELSVWLLIGSISSIRVGDKLANRSFLFSPHGEIVATYDKIHMFDIDLPGGESYRESDTHQPGNKTVLADMDGFKLGMSVCYDVRFPHLYRALAKQGAQILSVPSAFTVPTGRAHWEILLRARAIENGAFVVAPAQCGTHDGGRGTWGHSMIISPWGDVLADGGDKPGIIFANLDMEAVTKARAAIPSLQHDRKWEN